MIESSESKLYFGIALVAILLFSLFLILQIALLQKTLRVVVNAVARISFLSIKAPQTQSGIEGWETYRNEKYGFEFQYPNSWYFDTFGALALDGPVELTTIPRSAYSEGGVLPSGAANISITSVAIPLQLNNFIANELRGSDLLSSSTILISGVSCNWEVYSDSFGGYVTYNSVAVYCPHNNLLYKAYLDYASSDSSPSGFQGVVNQFKQILSTFKFIKPTSTINISTWKTYRNEKYGFEVKYPAELYLFSLNNSGPCSDIPCIQNSPKEISLGSAPLVNGKIPNYVTTGYGFSFQVEDYPTLFDINKYLKTQYPGSEVDTLSQITIDGNKAYRFTFKNEVFGGEPEIIIPHGNKIYEADYWGSSLDGVSAFDQILPTFKFIQ